LTPRIVVIKEVEKRLKKDKCEENDKKRIIGK
jgi:hypothetical protein